MKKDYKKQWFVYIENFFKSTNPPNRFSERNKPFPISRNYKVEEIKGLIQQGELLYYPLYSLPLSFNDYDPLFVSLNLNDYQNRLLRKLENLRALVMINNPIKIKKEIHFLKPLSMLGIFLAIPALRYEEGVRGGIIQRSEEKDNIIEYILSEEVFLDLISEDRIYSFQKPTKIIFSNEDQVHSIHEPAICFGEKEYFVLRNQIVPEDIFKKTQNREITIEEVLRIKNEEIKGVILSMYQELHGPEASYQFVSESLKEVDSYSHKTGNKTLCYTLFKGQLGIYEVAYIRCYCPSTDRMFFLGVDSWNTNAKDAIASLYRIPFLLEPHIKCINRQGERFTTVLTRYGEDIRKNMTKEQFEDLVSISGNDYFNFMRYEY